MKNKVLITINSTTSSGMEKENVEVMSVGTCEEITGDYYVRYDELLEGEKNMTANLLKIRPEEMTVEMIKNGPVTAHMTFKENEKTHTFYETPYGAIDMGIYTRLVEISAEVGIVEAHVMYSIDVNGDTVSDCDIHITVK